MSTDFVSPTPVSSVTPKAHRGLAAVRSISEARSFRGQVHTPDWATLSIECLDVEAAKAMVSALRERKCLSARDDACVSISLDRNQPSSHSVPVEVAFIAASMGFADAEVAESALDAYLADFFENCP